MQASNFAKQGVLILHGFTGNPSSMQSVTDSMEEQGFEVEVPLLPGHGTVIDDLVPMRFSDWENAVQDAYSRLLRRSESVGVVGLSMGGTLGCNLVSKHPEIKGIAVINPFLEPPHPSFLDILKGLLDSGVEVMPGIGSDIKKPGVVEVTYDGTPVRAALSLFEALKNLSKDLQLIKCPVLLFSSRHDHVVPSSSGDLLVEKVSGNVVRIWLEDSYHVATLDYDSEKISKGIVDFMIDCFRLNQTVSD
ncbi:MAG: alpha/beta fold hydrolase [Actinobacteria bacterium]|jgi:carboxylesterase|nr:alpha/beta fold hydrolase [Actinomycetota bacterium]MCL6104984.1 alpha/beta fold hydrolase [Actinomycetota bacterium]